MQKRGKLWLVSLAVTLAVFVGWYVRQATADGPPTTTPLYFSGTATDRDGTPLEGPRLVVLDIYDAAEGGTRVCGGADTPTLHAGRFRVALTDPDCRDTVAANPDLWVEAAIDGLPALSPRMKLAAVPYAIEAGRASGAAGALEARLAEIEDGAFCPRLAGHDRTRHVYVKDLSTAGVVRCTYGSDSMVKVGDFWIDQYEASVWENEDCTGGRYGSGTVDNYPDSFPDNGNYTDPLYACSVTGVSPSRYLTWFQAQQVCIASGKHLCTNEEWQAAAAGTHDPGSYPGTLGACGSTSPAPERCNTCSTGVRATGEAGSVAGGIGDCVSTHGVQDMIGNLREWVASWQQAGPTWMAAGDAGADATPWPSGYGSDKTLNINGRSHNGSDWTNGLLGAPQRGGYWSEGADAGVFATALDYGASGSGAMMGFRCCLGR